MSPFDFGISHHWSKPAIDRVRNAATEHQIWNEAARATLEAIVRRLVRRGWKLRRSSKAPWDRRVDSRYLQPPDRLDYEIRLSNHVYPRTGGYHGQYEYIITRDIMMTSTILDIVQQIEADLPLATDLISFDQSPMEVPPPMMRRQFPISKHDGSDYWYDDKGCFYPRER